MSLPSAIKQPITFSSTMADTKSDSFQSLFHALDPISLILSHNPSGNEPVALRLAIDGLIMERGPRYNAYAQLRESKLRMRNLRQQEPDLKLTPSKKQVKFERSMSTGRKVPSVLAQSVPDFSAVLRKENRKPASNLPPMPEMTPPLPASKNWTRVSKSGGSKSANAGEKKGFAARKSYASIDELKGLSWAAASAINGENRGLRSGRVTGKTVLGYRQI